ncbi:hypothetical protein HYPSUDRAFT_1074753 [Hypholoma sublateritium FD-334 SS-4]|uniref:holo-[acyl-carrier-protein] synthase n=1 Tax=Hypholoma sublateritium (strain FD-334 SS-4) TaxID=945553 RepID=A0A0D2LB80_HYPSF|nr:hypothetical protein HYPSUDRAFT_1074753 [Hypholoma sublateritium FD-334 SS-4]
MQVQAVIYTPASFPDELYHRALAAVDAPSQARIERFYHRADACRTLIGRLLVRTMLAARGIAPSSAVFGATPAGKPFVVADPPIAYNITHDNGVVAMAVARGLHDPPAFRVGIDVMKLRVPGREGVRAFVGMVEDQLTPLEHRLLGGVPEDELLRRFFWMWTLKEAYTKALGLGLGFDFSRVEFDVVNRVVRVDGVVPEGWAFRMFVIADGQDVYEGVVAEYVGGVPTTVVHEETNGWLTVQDAVAFTENALDVLKKQ